MIVSRHCFLTIAMLVVFTNYSTAEDSDRFPDRLSQSIVALGMKSGSNRWMPLGTGFLMHSYKGSRPILVTNRHIFEPETEPGVVVKRKEIWAKVDLKPGVAAELGIADSTWAEFLMVLVKNDTVYWTGSHTVGTDIAIIDFPSAGRLNTMLGRACDMQTIPRSGCTVFDSLSLGQDVIFVGFPLGLGSRGNPQPFVRSGMISYLDANERIFWLDAQVFGGSSGSPVFSTGAARGDPPLVKDRALIGIVAGFKPSPIRLSSLDRDASETATDTIRFPVENAGLGIVFSVDLILETVEAHDERFHTVSSDSSATSEGE